jgi:hypothetical protein
MKIKFKNCKYVVLPKIFFKDLFVQRVYLQWGCRVGGVKSQVWCPKWLTFAPPPPFTKFLDLSLIHLHLPGLKRA